MSNLATLFDNMLRSYNVYNDDPYMPVRSMPVDITEDDDAYYITAEYPGIKKEDIKIELDNDVLTLSVSHEKKLETEDKNTRYLRKERVAGSCERQFRLPKTVDHKKIDANYEDGVLRIKIEKAEPAKPKLIQVKVK